jgi:hypothetical protein
MLMITTALARKRHGPADPGPPQTPGGPVAPTVGWRLMVAPVAAVPAADAVPLVGQDT